MPQGPAARVGDPVDVTTHPAPPALGAGPGSLNILIGGQPAWRGMPLASVAAVMTLKTTTETAIKTAEAATVAAAGTPGLPAAKAAEETVKATSAASMSSAMSSAGMGADIHTCTTPLPVPPHGIGMVITGSPTVLFNNLPACRQGDMIVETLGPPNKITLGLPTVLIGDSAVAGQGGALQAAAKEGKPFCEY